MSAASVALSPDYQPHLSPPPPQPTPTVRTKADVARENGRKSRGPTSVTGKQRSSRNALKHFFCAIRIAYSNQHQHQASQLHADLCREFHPQTPTELALVDTMARSLWQQIGTSEEIAAMVNHVRETEPECNEPGLSEALRNVLAIGKLNDGNKKFDNHQRYLREAERRQARAVRDLVHIRKNRGLLHEFATEDAAVGEIEEHEMDHSEKRNEPTDAVENTTPAIENEPTGAPAEVQPAMSALDDEFQAFMKARRLLHPVPIELEMGYELEFPEDEEPVVETDPEVLAFAELHGVSPFAVREARRMEQSRRTHMGLESDELRFSYLPPDEAAMMRRIDKALRDIR